MTCVERKRGLNMKQFLLVLVCLLVLNTWSDNLRAQGNSNKSGTTAAQFLKIGVGARAMGMGGSFVAHADDIYSLYWNPAGLTKVEAVTISAVQTQWFADISHNFFGFVLPVDGSSAIGAQVITLNMDEIEITTIDDPHGTNEFYDASDLAIGLSYAKRLTNYFALGVTGKYIQQKIYNESASTFAFDIGSVLNIPYYGLKLGMAFSNFGGSLKMEGRDLTREFDLNPDNSLNDGVEARLKTEPWDLPVNFSFGLALDIIGGKDGLYKAEQHQLTFDITGSHPADADEYASIGFEYTLSKLISIRTGYRSNRDVEKMFYGAGLHIPMGTTIFNFDYAIASFEDLDYIHVFSASIAFK